MIFTAAGCGFKDIDKRFFAVGIGIDKSENSTAPYKITLKLAIPNTEPKKGGSDFITITEESDSLAEGVRHVKAKVDKELTFGHMQIIVFGEKLAYSDLKSALDWLMRRRDIQRVAFTAVGSPDAKSVLDKKLYFESMPSSVLVSSFDDSGTQTNYITSRYLFDFNRRVSELGLDPMLPVISVERDNFNINQLALFEKSPLKIKVILSPDETKLFNVIASKRPRTSFEIKSEKANFILDAHNIRIKYKIDKYDKSNTGEVKFNVKISGYVEESMDRFKEIDLKDYEDMASKVIEKKITELLEKIQEEGIDPLGLGLYYRSRNWNNDTKWNDWEKLYPNLKFKVKADVKIKSTGLMK